MVGFPRASHICAMITRQMLEHCGVSLLSRLTVVSREANKKQHAHVSSSLRDHYSELFTWMAALKFENAVTQPL